MEYRVKEFIKPIVFLSIFILLFITGVSTDKQVSADNSSRILVSNVTSDLANSLETTTTTITTYIVDDQRDVKYFEIHNSNLIYKNEDELDANPTELIIPKTINGETVSRFGWTQTFYAGLESNTSYGPFYKCSRLERLFIPDTVHDNVLDYEDSNPFKDCKYDGKYIDIYIYADDIQSFLEYSYGENFGLSYNALVNGKVVEELTIPDNITEVIDGAFFKCKSLKNVYIPEYVVSLGDNAFNSENMESITIYNPNCKLSGNSISNNSSGNYSGIIYGYTNSTAHVYAEENGYTFAALDQDNEVVCTSRTTEITTQIQTTQTTVSKEGEVVVSLVETSQTTTLDTENTETVTTDITTTSAVSNITTEKTTSTETTTTSTITTEPIKIAGDASGDNKLDVRDCAYIARMLAKGKKEEIPENADFNGDEIIDVRDAAAIARYLASK